MHGLAVDGDARFAADRRPQPRGGDDDVGVQLLARREPDALLCDGRNLAGDDARGARAQGLVEIGVGRGAQPLRPGIVRGHKVGRHGGAGRQLLLGGAEQQLARGRGPPQAVSDKEEVEQRAAEAHEGGAEPRGQPALHKRLERAAAILHGNDPARRALEHRDVCGPARHARQQRHGRGARADDDDVLAGVVKVLGPKLGMDDGALELVDAGDDGLQRLVVVVVARAEADEAAAQLRLDGVLGGNVKGPRVCFAGPAHGVDFVAEFNVRRNALLLDGLVQVLLDQMATCNRRALVPWLPREAERVEVRVGSNA